MSIKIYIHEAGGVVMASDKLLMALHTGEYF